jgi:hypothetical protein
MYLPQINEIPVSEISTDVFQGYNNHLKVSDGEFSAMQRVTLDEYPTLCTRELHGVTGTVTKANGMIAKDRLAWVDGTTLYYNGQAVTLPAGVSLTDSKKILVSMGAYICVFPDGVYYNTVQASDSGYMSASYTHDTSVSQATFTPCLADGSGLDDMFLGPDEPPAPTNGDYWMDTSTTPHSLKVYSGYLGMWSAVATVYTKITMDGIDDFFGMYDGVEISGINYSDDYPILMEQTENLNGTHVVYGVGEDYIIVQNILDEQTEQNTGTVTVKRTVPDMDFVIESNNRLWGCKYGLVGGQVVNEIYACALGDFKNWKQYLGVSTDSYAAAIGAEGKFTGAITYQGYPTFFKEGSIIRVYGTQPSSFQIATTAQKGVADGAGKSLAIVDGILYYLAKNEVVAYDGSAPQGISGNLGDINVTEAVAAAYRRKYIISCNGTDTDVYAYDARTSLWVRDGSKRMIYATATGEDDMYYIDANGRIVCWSGEKGTEEADEGWYVETGIYGWQVNRKKFISRFNIRLQLALLSTVTVSFKYDGDPYWTTAGTVTGTQTGDGVLKTVHMHVIPRRCDHMRMRIEGTGTCRILGISRMLEAVNDL